VGNTKFVQKNSEKIDEQKFYSGKEVKNDEL